jgi:competence protein ComEC
LDTTTRSSTFERVPAVVLAAAASLGIATDRWCPLPVTSWCVLASLMVVSGLMANQLDRANAARLRRRHGLVRFARHGGMAGCGTFCLAAAWHAWNWNTVAATDLVHVAPLGGHAVPVLVAGVATSSPVNFGVDSSTDGRLPLATPYARFRMQVHWLRRGGRWVTATGPVWVYLQGQPTSLRPGDQVSVVGNLSRYRPAMNPGERDFRAMHRARGERVLLRAPVMSCLQVIPRQPGWRWWLPRLRLRWVSRLRSVLPPTEAELAGAMLLGAREGLVGESRDRFMRTGTVHLLAVSGLHAGILAAPWLFVVRAGLIPFRGGLSFIIVLMAAYAGLAEGRAPVVRASVLVQILCLSWMIRRRVSLMNSLGCAALLVLVRNPADLFDPGAQLSFLAVAALGRCGRIRWLERWASRPDDPLDRLIWRTRPWWSRTLRQVGQQLMRGLVASGGVWLITAPLVVENFHVVSPLAACLNLVLIPPLIVGLQTGFATLLCAGICPPLVQPLATVCQWSLQGIEAVVRLADACPASHFWLVAPGPFAVGACYACVGLAWGAVARSRMRWLCYALAIACLLAGWSHQAWRRQQSRERLRCTILSVGHGTCVVVQLPDGQVWLYDAGRRGSVEHGVDFVSRYLWSQAIGRIDVIVLSHVDVDHYSLLPGLIERFGVRRFLTAHPRLHADGAGEAWLAARLEQLDVQPERIAAGQSWPCGGDGSIAILHPDAQASFAGDNAHSVVLGIQYKGSSILLPGDLESDGMEALLSTPPWSADLIMAPHHGSLIADPGPFLQWCRPAYCVISGADVSLRSTWSHRTRADRIRILHTAVDGAVEVDADERGLRVRPFWNTRNE